MKKLLFAVVATLGVTHLSFAGYDKSEIKSIIGIVGNSGITASQAITQVQSNYQGTVYDYELEDEDGMLFHEFKLIDVEEDVKRKIIISVHDGKVVSEESESLYSWFREDDDVTAVKKLSQNQYSILEAIEQIGLLSDDLLLDVELEDKQGVVYFEIEFFKSEEDEERELLVDSKTKSIIPLFKR